MKAIILAGGKGERLLPLTLQTPKVMLPILNLPLLEHTIAYLREHGITEIILAVGHMSESIQNYFGDGKNFGVELVYSYEEIPLGTAGAVKNAQKFLGKETFLVLNGDVFTDLNLNLLLEFHASHKDKCTLDLAFRANSSSYGRVNINSKGLVSSFTEKKESKELDYSWINAGVYVLESEILEYIPEEKFCMFEREVFPLLVNEKKLYGFWNTDYWIDIGRPRDYLRLNCDILSGHTKTHADIKFGESDIIGAEFSLIHSSAKITGPVLIGDNSRIGKNVNIIGPVVMGVDCHIKEGALVDRAVILGYTVVGEKAMLSNCIVSGFTILRIDKL